MPALDKKLISLPMFFVNWLVALKERQQQNYRELLQDVMETYERKLQEKARK